MQQQKEQQSGAGFLTGKKVIVLGGSSGIGLATAKAAADEGASVIIVSSNQARINDALKQLPEGSQGFAVDLTEEQQVKDFFANVGPLDHLVFSAGEALQIGNIVDVSIADAKKFFDLRYWGAFMAVKYAAPNIRSSGSIVLTGGAASQRPGKGWSLGASICAAMEGFARAMAIELAPIRVNIVVPGIVKTNLWSNMPEAEQEAMYTHFANILPVGRVGEAEDIAQTYLYLIRQQYGTGQRITIDGGHVLV